MHKVAVITGTNSNLGLNIAYRLISKLDDGTRLTIVATSRTLPRVKEAVKLIKEYAIKVGKDSRVDFDYVLLDLADMISILGAFYELSERYDAIHYFFANAAQGTYSHINWFQAAKDVITNPLEAVTHPTYTVQKVGVTSRDGMGLVFQTNVFGPYYLIRKLIPQLSKGNGVVVWISSLLCESKYLSLQDIQLLKTNQSYEGSKRLVDVLHLGTFKELKQKGISQYVTHPGIFLSNSFTQFLNFFTYYSMLFLFYLARWYGSPWHNVDGFRAANAPVYVATLANPTFDKQELKYGSAVYRDGMEYIDNQEIDPTGANDVHGYFETLAESWDDKLKDQIVNSRKGF